MRADYYMELEESAAEAYYMEIVESVESDYYMEPVGKEEAGWEQIGEFKMFGGDASLDVATSPGSYDGYARFLTLTQYEKVRLVGYSGWWNDGTGAPDYAGFMDVVTQIDYERMGTINYFNTAAEATDAWVGKSAELNIGDDGLVGWGIDDYGANNTGTLTFRVYGKPKN